jgi:hypothetical protein
MKALRTFTLSAVLAVAALAPSLALAQGRVTDPGTYDASIVYIPGISVPGGLPDCVDQLSRQIYVGELTVARNGSGYTVTFVGENDEDPTLRVRATARFNSNWGGFLLGGLGGRDDAIMGIDAANIESGLVTGRVVGENGHAGTLVARIGSGGEIVSCRFVGRGAR